MIMRRQPVLLSCLCARVYQRLSACLRAIINVGWSSRTNGAGEATLAGRFGVVVFKPSELADAHGLKGGFVKSLRLHKVPFPTSLKMSKHNHVGTTLGYCDEALNNIAGTCDCM